jgi:hypothetical protein
LSSCSLDAVANQSRRLESESGQPDRTVAVKRGAGGHMDGRSAGDRGMHRWRP